MVFVGYENENHVERIAGKKLKQKRELTQQSEIIPLASSLYNQYLTLAFTYNKYT